MKRERKRLSVKTWLAISLIMCLVSSIGASLIQSDFGNVTVKKLHWETSSGLTQSALLLVPDSATADSPAPAIVTCHGWFNSKEWQDMNYIEYARRGYVVIALDMYGHGDSDIVYDDAWWQDENNADGMYDSVKLLASLPYVDSSRIGVTGHSNGGYACLVSTALDDAADEQLISAVLLVCQDPIYTADNTFINNFGRRVYDVSSGDFINYFGTRDAGFIAAQHDEFFGSIRIDDDSYAASRDYIHTAAAQSFLYFGTDPTGQEERAANTIYTEEIDGESVNRAVYTPDCIHPAAPTNSEAAAAGIDFFEASFGAPNSIASSNQIWQWKLAFNTLGLVGLLLFLVFFMLTMLETAPFAVLKSETLVASRPMSDGKAKKWFWGSAAVSMVFSIFVYVFTYRWCVSNRPKIFASGDVAFFQQLNTFYIGLWSLLCGLFILLLCVLSYKLYGKKHGADLRELGIVLPKGRWVRTLELALLTVLAAYAIVFTSDYFFKTDYRCWCLPSFRAFDAFHWAEIWKYFIFFVPYYIMLSVSTNCFNYTSFGKKHGDAWGLVVNAVAIAFGPLLMIAIQYIPLYVGGYQFTELYPVGGSLIGLWLFPIAFILPVAVIMSRAVYKRTRNPYIVGIMMGVLMTIATVTTQLTNP